MHDNIRSTPAAQLTYADSLPRHSVPFTGGTLAPAIEQFARRQLILFEQRCQTLADRVGCQQLKFLDAVDLAYEAATWSGLVDAVGDDLVQATMANAFMKVCQP
jgi:hypothetical protein